MGRKKRDDERSIFNENRPFMDFLSAAMMVKTYKSVEEQVAAGNTVIEIDIENLTRNEEEDLYYSLMWGHTRAGSEAGLLDSENPIIREDNDFAVYKLKDNITSTDKRYLLQKRQEQETIVSFFNNTVKKTLQDEECNEKLNNALMIRAKRISEGKRKE